MHHPALRVTFAIQAHDGQPPPARLEEQCTESYGMLLLHHVG